MNPFCDLTGAGEEAADKAAVAMGEVARSLGLSGPSGLRVICGFA